MASVQAWLESRQASVGVVTQNVIRRGGELPLSASDVVAVARNGALRGMFGDEVIDKPANDCATCDIAWSVQCC